MLFAGPLKGAEIGADKQPVGFEDKAPVPFTHHTLELEQGDSLYIFTDGFADQFGGTHGKKFKYKQLKEKLCSMYGLPMQEQEQELVACFRQWRGDLEQVDDVLVIGINILHDRKSRA